MQYRYRSFPSMVFALLLLAGLGGTLRAQGIVMSASGPVNRSMGGASTAAPLDALGAIYWNPASISGMESSQTEFSLDLLFASQTVSSSAGPFQGSTSAEPGVFPIPNVACVYKTTRPAVTWGLGVNAVAGFKTNLPADPSNPILAPSPVGLGRVSSEASFMQIAPVLSLALHDRFSIGLGPTITTGQIGVEPFVFDAPNSNGQYAAGRASRYHWGAGAQLGMYYIHNEDVRFGASLKSPTWMEQFEFFSTDAAGNPRRLTADIDLPLILSLGTSYAGFEHWLLALDVRFLDYGNTAGLGDVAEFDATGQLQGLDWSSVFATALGAEYRFNESLAVRAGYTFNQNPVSNREAFFNLATPLIYQHMLSYGLSAATSESTTLHLAHSYMLENTRTGPLYAPGIGALAGTQVENRMDAHFLSFGLSVLH
ncbi:MAG: outer membrane protein transport protein [Planctomycetales bacterium]|nr:outer membrane protein transport protein [Planctomycetales bacterium]